MNNDSLNSAELLDDRFGFTNLQIVYSSPDVNIHGIRSLLCSEFSSTVIYSNIHLYKGMHLHLYPMLTTHPPSSTRLFLTHCTSLSVSFFLVPYPPPLLSLSLSLSLSLPLLLPLALSPLFYLSLSSSISLSPPPLSPFPSFYLFPLPLSSSLYFSIYLA